MNQPTTQQNMVRTVGYDVKTFTTNIRNRSPMAHPSNYSRRSPIKKDQRSIDSGGGEMVYLEPNDMNYRVENMSQIQNNYIMRSPMNQTEEYFPQYQAEYERAQLETSQQIRFNNTNRIPQFNLDIDKRRERLSRSPKTINIGESAAEVEYNLRTVQGMMNRSPKMSVANSPMENPMAERSYNMMSSEAGNIFLDQTDQRIQQASFIRQNDIMGSPGYIQQTSYEMKNSNDFRGNDREIRATSWHFTKNESAC